MPWKPTIKALLLLGSDLFALYLGLFFSLLIRLRVHEIPTQLFHRHLLPFTIIFLFWILVFYIAGLYDIRRLRNTLDFFKTLCLAIVVNAVISIIFFYLIPIFGIAPKTTLFIFILVFTCIELLWRPCFNKLIAGAGKDSLQRMILVGGGERAETIHHTITTNPQIGYEIPVWLQNPLNEIDAETLRELVKKHNATLLLIPRSLKRDVKLTRLLYEFLSSGNEVRDFPNFYEQIFRKVPLDELEESWFLEHLTEHQKYYDPIKRGLEFVGALLLQIIILPLEILIALLILLTSPGPIIYSQIRIGRGGKPFVLHKFRTMSKDAERHGAQWATANDARITFIGRILRATHLDEFPQLINIIRGELSFVGPRPERPEFVSLLTEKIPYYEMRHLVSPGITGWAQINYRYGSSVEDAIEKLQYEIYYLKTRSLALDLAIILKTLKLFFVSA
jgi:exopolysaccharide biosynthesis polyprenyl glycosylphosphotransferase